MEKIWWEKVPNALDFCASIIEQLNQESSIVIQYSSELPWREYFIDKVKSELSQNNASKSWEVICNVDNLGEYLLRNYCKPEKRAQYRPTISHAKFLAESDDIVLHNRFFWIKISNQELLEKWSSFVIDYCGLRGKNKDSAVFVLEWNGEKVLSKKYLRAFSLDEFISRYDQKVFAVLASSQIHEDPVIKQYLAELTSDIMENDIELAACGIKKHKELLENPYDCICHIIETDQRSNGTEFRFIKDEKNVLKSVWKSQIKTIYPLIEEYRNEFISRYESQIGIQLPIYTQYCVYEEPNDVEIGVLKFMVDNGLMKISEEERYLLDAFKVARDKLSHLHPLTIDSIRELLF